MEWITVIVSSLTALIGAIGGGSIIYFKQTRRLKDAEAMKAEVEAQNHEDNSEIERWRNYADRMEQEVKRVEAERDAARRYIQSLRAEAGELYKERDTHRNEITILTNRFNSAMQFVALIKHNYCTNHPCPAGKRIPPDEVTIEQMAADLEKIGVVLPVDITEQNDITKS